MDGSPDRARLCVSGCHVFIKWLLKCIWILSLTRGLPRHMIKNLTRLRVSGLLTSEEQALRSRLISRDLHMHVGHSRSSMDCDVQYSTSLDRATVDSVCKDINTTSCVISH